VVAVGKCDVDENRQFAKSFGISSIPAIFFIKSGKIVDMQIGYCNKEELKKKFEKLRK
jgi:thioredoxin 1